MDPGELAQLAAVSSAGASSGAAFGASRAADPVRSPELNLERFLALHQQASRALYGLVASGRLRLRLNQFEHRSHLEVGLAPGPSPAVEPDATQWNDFYGEVPYEGFMLTHPRHLCSSTLECFDLLGIFKQAFADSVLGMLGLAPVSALCVLRRHPLPVVSESRRRTEYRDQVLRLREAIAGPDTQVYASGRAVGPQGKAGNFDALVAISYLLGLNGHYDRHARSFSKVRRVGPHAVLMDAGNGNAAPPEYRDLIRFHPRKLLRGAVLPSIEQLFACSRRELTAGLHRAEDHARMEILLQLGDMHEDAAGARALEGHQRELHAHVQDCLARLERLRD